TDSGGLQEESTALGIPCLTLRENTERPITVTNGTNRVVGNRTADIISGVDAVLGSTAGPTRIPELWDGRAAERVAAVLARFLAAGGACVPGCRVLRIRGLRASRPSPTGPASSPPANSPRCCRIRLE